MRILLQFPEGLKKHAVGYAEGLEKAGNEVFLLARATYGACDLPIEEARSLKIGKIIHFGHTAFSKVDISIPIEYVPFEIRIDVSLLSGFAEMLAKKGVKMIGIATTAQHLGQLGEMKALFSRHGIKALAKKGHAASHEGQILGCDASALDLDVDNVAVIADGMFHALAAMDIEGKTVYSVNPYDGKWKMINEEIGKIRKKELGSLAMAYDAKVFGILVSTKPGQFGMAAAERAKKAIEKAGRKAYILVSNELRAGDIDNFMLFDAYINCACPRMIDDTASFRKPVINAGNVAKLIEMWSSNSNK